ncbi:sulfur oxidation c-type cytochrome SoxA [Caenimonas sp. SL110]|uniref:sulfur oxidation c-type cytochrome SoxA n=1 Tax=Caenimonas sp. SL110 TaxID=1450524 RepID=UPI000654ABFB|nr:sulfur oxidation c-type cytochrome SoxA [Caenimonas sp. SL110]
MTRSIALIVAALLLGCAAPMAVVKPDNRKSGFDSMSASTQAMQRDDAANPAMLSVQDGKALWGRAPAASSRACASCHGDIASMKGVAARYPAWDELSSRPVDLGMRINACRQRHQGLPSWPREHGDLLSLEAAVAMQSRGMSIAPSSDERLLPFRARGEKLFNQRIGQLDLSCMQCHDQLAGGRLAASVIPQGHATGYPIYRLEWQAMGSLARRIRGCMTGVRAEPLAADSVELVELELHLAARAMGMAVETPAVRP